MTAAGDGGEEPRPRDDAFVWCTEESLVAREADGFEWEPSLVETPPAPSSDGESKPLDPTLVTSRRLPARDDEAVALLARLKRDPASGRWRRAETEVVERAESE